MGPKLSTAQLVEYREVVKDRLSDEAIGLLHMKFTQAAPDGLMTPQLFAKYINNTGVYKDKKIAQRQSHGARRSVMDYFFRSGAAEGDDAAGWDSDAMAAGSWAEQRADTYTHLFRGYDIDRDGIVTFKEFLMYHLAIVYSTEELFYVVFNAYDEDGDGYLSLGDVKTVITAATRYVGDCDVRDAEVQRVIDGEARRLMGFLDIRQQGLVQKEDMRLITQKHPEVLEKMKNLM